MPQSSFVRSLCSVPRRRARARLGSALGFAAAALLGACAPPAERTGEPLALRQAAGDPTAQALASVSLGESTTCATTLDGQAKCWGRGDEGRLGLGLPVADEPDPAALVPVELGQPATAVVTNGAQSFARLGDGSVRAFGPNPEHELGSSHTETIGDDETPALAAANAFVPLAGPAQQLAAGEGFGCARLDDGRVQCWGRGDEGQLGRGVEPGSHLPGDVLLGVDAVEIAAGAAHACARTSQGAVRCWGLGDVGQLGYGRPIDDEHTPADAGDVPLDGVAVQLAAGGAHTCARLQSGAVRCWGDNADGQLGYGHTRSIGDDETPAAAGDVALGGAAIQLAAGLRHTCALLEGGALRCWGDGSSGQLGLDPTLRIGDDEHPLEVAIVDVGDAGVDAIFTGALAEHTCAQLGDGQLRCWGRNDRGQLGLGFVSPSDPVEGPPGDLPDVIVVEDPDA